MELLNQITRQIAGIKALLGDLVPATGSSGNVEWIDLTWRQSASNIAEIYVNKDAFEYWVKRLRL